MKKLWFFIKNLWIFRPIRTGILSIKPDDILVVQFPERLPESILKNVSEYIHRIVGEDMKVIIVCEPVTFLVIRREVTGARA